MTIAHAEVRSPGEIIETSRAAPAGRYRALITSSMLLGAAPHYGSVCGGLRELLTTSSDCDSEGGHKRLCGFGQNEIHTSLRSFYLISSNSNLIQIEFMSNSKPLTEVEQASHRS